MKQYQNWRGRKIKATNYNLKLAVTKNIDKLFDISLKHHQYIEQN